MCNAAVDLLNAATPTLKFRDAGNNVLCSVNLNAPAFGPASGGSASLDVSGGALQGTVTSSGTCTNFVMVDSTGVVGSGTVIAGTVGTSGADINLSSVNFQINNVIQIDAITYSAAL